MRIYFRLAAFLTLAAWPIPSVLADVSHSARAIPAVKTPTPPTIDGDISDSAWSAASKAETFIDPHSGKPVADQTTAMILYECGGVEVWMRPHIGGFPHLHTSTLPHSQTEVHRCVGLHG